MKFGIFDHMDQGAGPLGEQYEERTAGQLKRHAILGPLGMQRRAELLGAPL